MSSLLNNERISTQLRDWKQIAQQKALAYAGCMEGRGYEIEAKRYSMLLEYIDDLLEEIRVIRANHAQLLKDFDARNEVIEELQRDCAEAYQVIGALGGDNLEYVEKALDNLLAATSGLPRPHNDLLPFSIPQTSADERIAQPEAELSDARANNH